MRNNPDLVNHYLRFCRLRSDYLSSKDLDVGRYNFYYPVTILPLINFIKEHSIKYVYHPNAGVNRYLSIITSSSPYRSGKTYVPIVELPYARTKLDFTLKRIINLVSKYGGSDAFNYVIYELSENIYEHSNFRNAFLMAQRYSNFLEICILDNGVTIPGNIMNNYPDMSKEEDYQAIYDAIEGLSTKKEEGRGYGLGSSVKLFTKGLEGKLFIVSRCGACYIDKSKPTYYKLNSSHRWDGTLISMRVPLPPRNVDIYQYIYPQSDKKL